MQYERLNVLLTAILLLLAADAIPAGTAMAAPIDAVLEGGEGFEGKSFFFTGGRYRRLTWTTDAFDEGGSLPIFAFHVPPSFRNGISAALAGRGPYAPYGYLFKGNQYVTYDWRTWNVTEQDPIDCPDDICSIDDWNLPSPFDQGIDAAINGEEAFAGKAFLFKGSEYVRYDWSSGAVDPGYPLPLSSWGLTGAFATGVDSVVAEPGGDVLFVRGEEAMRYSWQSGATTGPEALGTALPDIAALDDPPTRRVILYITIDSYESDLTKYPIRRVTDTGDHVRNIRNVMSVMEGYPSVGRPRSYVDPWWAKEVDSEMLADPHLFAVFSGGSYVEWNNLALDPEWRAWIQDYFEALFAAEVPVLAVCGSHQGMSGVLSGWHSVRHMSQEVNGPAQPLSCDPLPPPPTCSASCAEPWPPTAEDIFGYSIDSFLTCTAEADSSVLDPPAERGAQYIQIPADDANDPIFSGITSGLAVEQSVHFFESHHDEVIDGEQHPDFTRIATAPAEEDCCRESQRSTVQMLKFTGSDRVIYSTQFHPDIADLPPSSDANVESNANAAQLMRNFVDLAWAYWDAHPEAMPVPSSRFRWVQVALLISATMTALRLLVRTPEGRRRPT